MGAKSLHIRLNKIDGFIKVHNQIRYLVLFDYRHCDEICGTIKHLISEKCGITDSINHNTSIDFARIRIDSYDSLPIKKILTLHNAIILIKSTHKNNYCYNIFLEKSSYKDKSSTEYFSVKVFIS